MSLERTTENYGSGSGRTAYESELFRVVLWRHASSMHVEQNRTVITCTLLHGHGYYVEGIAFDGLIDETYWNSDEACFKHFTFDEVQQMFEAIRSDAYEKGRKDFKRGLVKMWNDIE